MRVEREIRLPSDPDEAARTLCEASRDTDVVVFKKSPICPVSTRAEVEFKTWLATLGDSDTTRIAMIDVIAEKPLARGLTAALGVVHESPQALWFSKGELAWHNSHGALTRDLFAAATSG